MTSSIHPVTVARYLGVHLDAQLTLKQRINRVVSISSFMQLRRLRKFAVLLVKKLLSFWSRYSYILGELDYYNSALCKLALGLEEYVQCGL
jgi:hypothetical protein